MRRAVCRSATEATGRSTSVTLSCCAASRANISERMAAVLARVVEHEGSADPRRQLLQQLQALRGEVHVLTVDTREPPSGLPEALNQSPRFTGLLPA